MYTFHWQSTSCGETTPIQFSQPGESPIPFQPGGSGENFPRKNDVFAWLKKKKKRRARKKAPCMKSTWRQTRQENFPGKARSDKSKQYNIYLFYCLSRYFMLPRRKCPQNRYFKGEQLCHVDCSRGLLASAFGPTVERAIDGNSAFYSTTPLHLYQMTESAGLVNWIQGSRLVFVPEVSTTKCRFDTADI